MEIQNIKPEEVFLTLGIIWILIGTLIYNNYGITSFGIIILIIGLITKYTKNKI